jgi:ABC-type Fe3+ transport system permease subunit
MQFVTSQRDVSSFLAFIIFKSSSKTEMLHENESVNLFVLIFCTTIAIFLGRGYYDSLRTGVLTVRGRTSRRDREPIRYWLGMLVGIFAFLVAAFATVLMAFLICVDSFSK